MSYLLDSHIVLWMRYAKKRLGEPVLAILENPDESVYYSVVTPWEFSIKHAKGKLPVPEGFFEGISKMGFDCLPVEEAHIHMLRTLPLLHDDPFDRMLVAQAKAENLTLITADKKLTGYPIKTLLGAQ